MESVSDFEGDSVFYGDFTSADALKHQLMTSLTSFQRLYSRHRDLLQDTSQSFALTAAQLRDLHGDVSVPVRGLLSVFGGAVGAACGAVTGGVFKALWKLSAPTCRRIYSGAVNGLLYGMIGAVCGGVLSGAVGGAICAATKATGSPVNGVVGDVVWLPLGAAIGAFVCGVGKKTVGAAVGGAAGGALGASIATRLAVFTVRGVVDRFSESQDSKEKKRKSANANVRRESRYFSTVIEVQLGGELRTIQTILGRTASTADMRCVAEQINRVLDSVTTMERTVCNPQSTTDPPPFDSSVEEAARQSKKITGELEEMEAQVETLLVSLRQ